MFLNNSADGLFVFVTELWLLCNDQLPVTTNNFLFVLGEKNAHQFLDV